MGSELLKRKLPKFRRSWLSQFPAMHLKITSIVSYGLLFAPFLVASQSSIQSRGSYNSEKQMLHMVSGVWGFADRTYVNGGMVFSRTPLTGASAVDTYYQGNIGAGHAIDNLALDAGFVGSYSPLTAITSKGGYIGVTYIHVPSVTDPATQSDHALALLHTQIYPEVENRPLFWIRAGFMGNTMSSTLVNPPNNKAKGTSFTLDGTYPYDAELLISAGMGFHGFDTEGRKFFAEAQRNSATLGRYLLGATVQGLAHTTANFGFAYSVTNRDTFMPRYATTEIESTRQWSHTIDIGWRHQFSKALYATPTYEISISGNRAFSGFLLDFMYLL